MVPHSDELFLPGHEQVLPTALQEGRPVAGPSVPLVGSLGAKPANRHGEKPRVVPAADPVACFAARGLGAALLPMLNP